MKQKQLIAKEVEKNTIKIMKLFNAGVPFVGLEPSKIKLENRLNQFATNIAKAVLADVRENGKKIYDIEDKPFVSVAYITKREKELEDIN